MPAKQMVTNSCYSLFENVRISKCFLRVSQSNMYKEYLNGTHNILRNILQSVTNIIQLEIVKFDHFMYAFHYIWVQ